MAARPTRRPSAGGGGAASDVTFSPSGLAIITGTNVQAALAQLDAATAGKAAAAHAHDGTYVALAGSTSTGEQVAPSFKATGKTGATSTPITLAGGTASGAPTTGAHIKGEVVVDDLGRAWYCTVAGTPGTWVQIGGGLAPKRTVRRGGGNLSITGTTLAALDATNLGFLTHDLAIGDVVRCTLTCVARHGTTGQYLIFDAEIDQPTSANVFASGQSSSGFGSLVMEQPAANYHVIINAEMEFTATEAGVHGFRPVGRVAAGTMTIDNSATANNVDNTPIVWMVEKLGPVTA